MRLFLLRPLFAASVLVALPAFAGQPFANELRGGPSILSGPETLRVQYLGDNDSLGWTEGPNGIAYDRWFTNSLKLTGRRPVSAEFLKLRRPARLLVSGSLGQVIYTPRTAEIASVEELQGDRPYSGWLAASVSADLIVELAPLALTDAGSPYTHFGLELFAGTRGPWSFAGPVQHTAHWQYLELEGKQKPPLVGWGVAETAPGFTADVSAFAETSVVALRLRQPSWLFDWSGASPGLYLLTGARADAGGQLVAGALSATFVGGWLGDPLDRRDAFIPFAAYLFVRAEGRAVRWNASIEAPILDGTSVAEAAPFVGELSAGFVVRVWKGEFSMAQTFRTNETSSLPQRFRTGQLIGHWNYTLVF